MASGYAPGSNVLATRVELRFSCDKLRDADLFSKSDPIVSIRVNDGAGGWREFSRTEWLKNTLNPRFGKAVEMQYRFEEVQKLQLVVFDIDNETDSLDDDDFLGQAEVTLGEVASQGVLTRKLQPRSASDSKADLGTITIRVEEMNDTQYAVQMKFSAQGLDKKDLFGKSDPYLEFAKKNPEDGTFTVTHRTKVIKNTLNPSWPTFEVSSHTLCSSDPQRQIKVTCYDWDNDGSHDLIGVFTTSLEELTRAQQNKTKLQWECINPSKKSKKKYKNSGTIYLENVEIIRTYSFLDYVMGGCQINFTVGIDFTGSNGDPRLPTSLHYIDPHKPNQYTTALIAVGEVCQDYDSDKLFPALGFGGNIGREVSHEFSLNGNPQNPYCVGIPGVVQAYHQALQNVSLWGPTNFSPIINHVARFAEQAATSAQNQQYFVLLMLTDGAISDMRETVSAIIKASRLPMSIIIVGVGDADFSNMDTLDADEGLLRQGSEVAERDIVQFVPFKKFKGKSPALLASAVLAEVPQQLTGYMRKKGIVPLARPQ